MRQNQVGCMHPSGCPLINTNPLTHTWGPRDSVRDTRQQQRFDTRASAADSLQKMKRMIIFKKDLNVFLKKILNTYSTECQWSIDSHEGWKTSTICYIQYSKPNVHGKILLWLYVHRYVHRAMEAYYLQNYSSCMTIECIKCWLLCLCSGDLATQLYVITKLPQITSGQNPKHVGICQIPR